MAASSVRVRICDQLDNACVADVDRDEPVHRILPSIVDRMKLPTVALDGQPLRYSLEVQDERNAFFTRRLGWDETLGQARVKDDSVLVVFVEMIAG